MKQNPMLIAGLFLVLSGIARAASENEVQTAIVEAETAYANAVSVQGAWVNTPRLIAKAQAAAAAENLDQALALAKAAKKEADLGQAQAAHELEHWTPPPYLR